MRYDRWDLQDRDCVSDQVERIGRRLSRRNEGDHRLLGRFGYGELKEAVMDELGVRLAHRKVDGPMGELLQHGRVIEFPCYERPADRKNGRMRVYRAVGIDRVNLADVLAECERRIGPGRRRRGRRASDDREVWSMNQKAFDRAKTALRQTAVQLHHGVVTPEEALEATSGRYLSWDPEGGAQSNGDWTAILQVAVEAARANAVQPGRYVGSVRMALDLAATWELIPRGELHGGPRHVIPTHWAEVQGRWKEAATQPGVAAVLGVNRLLKAIHDVLGPAADPESLSVEEAQRVVDHLSEAMRADSSLNAGRRTSIRRAVRSVRDAGFLPADIRVNGYDYRQGENARSAWGDPEVMPIARAFAQRTRSEEPDYSAWATIPFPGLVRMTTREIDGEVMTVPAPHTLPAVVDFYTMPKEIRHQRGLRPLGPDAFPTDRRPRNENESPEPWGSVRTVELRLKAWALFVGWVKRARSEIDLEQVDLSALVKPDLLEAFARSGYTTDSQVSRVMITVGLAASPVLEDQAHEEGREELADQYYRAACLASGKGKIDPESHRTLSLNLADTHQEIHLKRKKKREEEQFGTEFRNEAEKVEWVFREAFATIDIPFFRRKRAYDCYLAIYAAARRRWFRQYFGIERDGTSHIVEHWPEVVTQPVRQVNALRRLALVNFVLGAPIRTAGQSKVEVRHLHRTTDSLRLDTPGTIHKRGNNGPYRITLWTAAGDSTPTPPGSGFDVEMMNLYLEYVRPALLVGHESGMLWVTNMSAGRAETPDMLSGSIREDIRAVLRAGCEELGVDPAFTDMITGGAIKIVHSIRHAIGTKGVRDLNDVELVKTLLHHTPASTEALRTYSAPDEDASTHGLRARIGQRGSGST